MKKATSNGNLSTPMEKSAKVEEVNGASTYATNYEYNTRDELTKITDALGNINTLTYDTLGQTKIPN